MSQPLVTLVIPTRERAETLKYTLATAVAQDFDDFQILVSDNFSQDRTREVVESVHDARVTYVNTGQRLSMTDNFEFALDHARGKYVVYIGDDDGLVQGAVGVLGKLVHDMPSPIYCWECHGYAWPMDGKPPAIVNLTRQRAPQVVSLAERVDFSLRWGGLRDHLLPKAYHSAVQTSVLREIRKKTGRSFHSLAPDLFTGYALPAFAPTAVNTGVALTVAGYSAKANSGRSNAGTAHFQTYVKEFGDYRLHHTLYPGAPFVINIIQDATLTAMERLPEYYGGKKFVYEAMWAHMIRSGRYEQQVATPQSAWKSVAHLLAHRKEIRAYHPFSTPRFLAYLAANYGIKYMTKLRMAPRKKAIGPTAPDNIKEFVDLIGPAHLRRPEVPPGMQRIRTT